MRRADRLFAIVEQLRGGRRLTAARLGEVLEVSTRTIYRDVADLQGNGVPITGEAGFGYILEDGHTLPPLMLTQSELTALVTGMRMLRGWGGAAAAKSAEDALAKILDVVPEDARQKAMTVPVYSMFKSIDAATRAHLDEVEAAVEAKHRLALDYVDKQGAPSRRVVRPLGLWYWGDAWTVVGWCELRDDFRMFRVDRIRSMTDDGPFKPARGQTLRDFFGLMEAEGYAPPQIAGL